MTTTNKISAWLLLLTLATAGSLKAESPRSESPASVLREPLPPEELSFANKVSEFVITGPTFKYRVQKSTGVITGVRVFRGGQTVILQDGPADLLIDDYRLSSKANSAHVTVVQYGKDKVVLESKGVMRAPDNDGPEIDFSVLHTFFNDGVVVSDIKLTPRSDLSVRREIAFRLPASGEFSNYLHKRRDEHGQEAARGRLPASGQAVHLSTLTSCLSVFSPTAALAIFTDGGGTYESRPNLDTATIHVKNRANDSADLALTQYVVHVAPGDKPFVLKAGEQFSFRVGISVAPNRLPHPRQHDLRMFIWIGDAKYPYPTDEEITKVAHWGYTVFQLHRAGTPGDPRPPAGEFERVLKKVHSLGMLYVWEENADLLYDSAPGVQALKAKGQWSQWQGFTYGGRYTASMDPYCDLAGTCLASPNGMAEYRLANITRMLDKSPVDGIYLDDNLGYANCPLQKEHGHPQKIYDCLIELHEINWRRRELLRQKVPHLLLISHNTKAFVLPIIADFDIQYFAEGYCFDSAQDYWENYRAWSLANNAQAMICPGDDEGVRCTASLLGNYDWLTGGGQYSQMDWRLFPEKFRYAGGVSPIEVTYGQTYNLAQYYFGLYEAEPFYFATSTNLFTTTTPLTHSSIYRNKNWNEWLIPIANMSPSDQSTSLKFHSPRPLSLAPKKDYLLFDVLRHNAKTVPGNELDDGFKDITVPGQNLQLFSLRQLRANEPIHVWGGKRISENWNSRKRTLTFEIQGPPELKETIFITGMGSAVAQVFVDEEPAAFSFDPTQNLLHGEVTFTPAPLKIEVRYASDSTQHLPEKSVSPSPLIEQRARSRK